MNEKILAVPRDAIKESLKQGFFPADETDLMGLIGESYLFLDRTEAEHDPSHKQIIPYIVVSRGDRFLIYRRTSKQGENRLHNKFSLGFGGHINDLDRQGAHPTNLILTAMVRELNEEVFLPGLQRLGVIGFINDDANPVGQVHLGIAFLVELANDRFSVNEPEMIEAQWHDAEEIEKVFPQLESWSQILWSQHLSPQVARPQR
jgi:predicted NUDIX family phosphoesterase